MVDGEPGDITSVTVMETLTHSVLKTLLMEQNTKELHYLQEQVDMVNFQSSESPSSSRESIESEGSETKK